MRHSLIDLAKGNVFSARYKLNFFIKSTFKLAVTTVPPQGRAVAGLSRLTPNSETNLDL